MNAPGRRGPRGRPDLAYADTNLFVALLVGPGHPLHEQALGLFRRVADGQVGLIVTPVVVAELVYVARSLLGWTRRLTAQRLGPLLEADGLVLTEGPTIARALRLYWERSRLDFADAYLAALALEVGPRAVASFDADLDTVEGVRRISA
jgi:predicted nucleic acid-binding protein